MMSIKDVLPSGVFIAAGDGRCGTPVARPRGFPKTPRSACVALRDRVGGLRRKLESNLQNRMKAPRPAFGKPMPGCPAEVTTDRWKKLA
jgi:hypothetical protein